MKLRNKKTGEAVYVDFQIPLSNNHEVLGSYCVASLKELNKRFEDYEPAEPLIKDEKIRKAVRAWAEANKLDELYLANNGYEIYGGAYDTVMQFVGEPLPHDNKDKTYTIEELCGEEEE